MVYSTIFWKSHPLYKIFNKNKIKDSYSCISNISQIIKQHNKNVSNKKENQTDWVMYLQK